MLLVYGALLAAIGPDARLPGSVWTVCVVWICAQAAGFLVCKVCLNICSCPSLHILVHVMSGCEHASAYAGRTATCSWHGGHWVTPAQHSWWSTRGEQSCSMVCPQIALCLTAFQHAGHYVLMVTGPGDCDKKSLLRVSVTDNGLLMQNLPFMWSVKLRFAGLVLVLLQSGLTSLPEVGSRLL